MTRKNSSQDKFDCNYEKEKKKKFRSTRFFETIENQRITVENEVGVDISAKIK